MSKQIVSLSGGKDSTAMLLMMLEKGEQIDDIVFFDWGMEFPQMYEHLEKLEGYIGQKITRLYPKHSFEFYLLDWLKVKGTRKGEHGYGWPHFRRRWCTRVKYDAVKAYIAKATNCLGLSYEERHTRATYKNGFRYPLLEWGVAEKVARDYCYSKGFDWSGLYQIFSRVSCWHCPFQSRKELTALRDNFPDLWQRLLEMDSKSPYTWPNDNLEKVKALGQ